MDAGAGDIILWTVIGATAGSLLACIPGMHIASVLALLLFLCGDSLGFKGVVPLIVAMVSAYSVIGFVPMVALSVPDESLFFAVTPTQAMNKDGYAFSAILKGGIGVMAGVTFSALMVTADRYGVIAVIFTVLRPHWHWMIWAAVLFMLMSEWPQRAAPGLGSLNRFISVWKNLFAGLLVFALSGALGLIVFQNRAAGLESSFAGLMPMLSGMFSVPWLLLALRRNTAGVFRDKSDGQVHLSTRDLLAGAVSGWLGGAAAVVVPGVTAGVGGMLSGHATAMNRRDAFVIAQGSSRGTYLAGGLLLMFCPGLTATRGGCAMMLGAVHEPFGQLELMPVIAVALTATGIALLIARYAYLGLIALTGFIGINRMALISLVILLAINWIVAGLWGICVLSTAAMIGSWAIASGARRMNCLGCILVPVGYAMSGMGG